MKAFDVIDANPIPRITVANPAAGSGDVVAENVAALKALFPAIVTDGRVDFDVLRQLLGDTVEEGEERYGLNWKGKRKARAFALTPTLATLRPAKEESPDWDNSQNIVVEGDNLEVLKCLRRSYAGRVKLIYIDPPYNTGSDFVYPDDYADSIGNYEKITGQRNAEGVLMTNNKEGGGRFHTDWLNMMYPRLMLAKDLLRDDGAIAVSIDGTEQANLVALMRDALGDENYLGELIIQTATDNNPSQISTAHESMVIFSRNVNHIKNWSRRSESAEAIQAEYMRLAKSINDPDAIQRQLRKWIRENADDLEGVTHYDNVDERGVFHDGDIANTRMGGYRSEVLHPITGKPCKVPDKGFRFPESTLLAMIARGDIMFGADHTTLMKPKIRLENARELLRSVIYEDGRASTKRLDALMAKGVFDNPKSETVLGRIFDFIVDGPDDIVLDFFAGSGTTGHAVMAQNAVDGGRRRYILVQLPVPLDPDNASQKAAAEFCDKHGLPRTIAELTKERLRRVGAKISAEHSGKSLDTGFRVYKLASSNLKPWTPDPDNLAASLLDAVDNVVPGRTEEDLLVELLLKTGIDLTLPMATREIAGRTVHALGGGVLIVCLGDVTDADAEALGQGIADWHAELDPVRKTTFYFRDSGFKTAAAKANVAAIIRQRVDSRVEKLASI